MPLSRKNFIKAMCLGSACLCGFTSFAAASPEAGTVENRTDKLFRDWLAEILKNLNHDLEEDAVRAIVKSASAAHYQYNKMDEVLTPYTGDVDAFASFLEKEWGWKVSFEENGNIINVDENKPFCVCPLVTGDPQKYPALCYCSEGFAEKMFAKVCGKPVTATVTSSIQRGDSKCMYRIEL